MRIIAACALALTLAACASEHEQQAQAQAQAAAIAANDDAKCRANGTAPGSPAYAQCRTDLDKQRASMPQMVAGDPSGCTPPYTNQYPPCQSTWPPGDPNYHGSTSPGPTFDSPF